MYYYIVNIQIDQSEEARWLDFMQHKHIHDVLETGYFTSAEMLKLMNEETRSHYRISYSAKSLEDIEIYRTKCSPALQQDVLSLFENQFSASREVAAIVKAFKP